MTDEVGVWTRYHRERYGVGEAITDAALAWTIRRVLARHRADTGVLRVYSLLFRELQARYPEDNAQATIDHMHGCLGLFEEPRQREETRDDG